MPRSARLVGSVLLALFLPVGALAQEVDASRSGPYLGVNVVGAVANFDTLAFQSRPVTDAQITDKMSLGVTTRAGWRLLPWLAVEGQYEWFDKWRVKTGTGDCATVRGQIVTGNLRFIAPLEAVQPYAIAGLGAGEYRVKARNQNQFCTPGGPALSDDEKWELAARFGGGFDVYITREIVFNLESTVVYSDRRLLAESFPFFSINGGLQYRF